VRRDPREVDPEKRGSPLPLRATSIVLAAWVTALLLIAFVLIPALFATCGAPAGGPGP
jgi:hypothetical protein